MNEGFYKNFDGSLICAPNFVAAPNYELTREQKDNYQYPVDGWHWFDSEDQAYTFFWIGET